MWGLWVVCAAVLGAALLLALSMFLLRKRAASRRGLQTMMLVGPPSRQHSKAVPAAQLAADLEKAAVGGSGHAEPSTQALLEQMASLQAQLGSTLAALRK